MSASQRNKGAAGERELFAAELAPAIFAPGRELATLRIEAAAQLMRAGIA